VSVNRLPANMLAKIAATDCPVEGLEGMCWTWTGCINSKGYGCVSIDGTVQLTHRVSYALHVAAIPADRQIDHLCRNKKCCNPRHLEAVTGKVNAERTMQAMKTRCVKGHPLAGRNLAIRKMPNGLSKRRCVACAAQYSYEQSDKRSAAAYSLSAQREAKRANRIAALIADGELALADPKAWEQDQIVGGAA